MSDFSIFALFTAGLACFAPLAAAYTQPTGDAPVGNPISEPGLNSVVPAGENFTVTWDPTTTGTVTLVLLKGPSSNAVPQYAIVEKIPNDGSYVWQVKSNLEPTENAQGYGIQLIDDATGQYQYTTQFGISNSHWNPSSYSSSSWSSSSWSTVESTTKSAESHTTSCETTTTSSSWAHHTGASTGIISKPANVTMISPTGYVPTTIATTTAVYSAPSTPSAAPSASTTPFKGSASTLATSFFGLAAVGAVALLAL